MSALEIAGVERNEVSQSEPQDGAVLAIDTALGTSVALSTGDGRIVELTSEDPRGHIERIGELIAAVFADAGVSPEQVTAVVMGVGPGPFTGLRVGMAAAQAFAVGRGVPLLPLCSHDAVALAALDGAGAQAGVRVVQDAKRRELFITEYSGLDWAGVPERSADPHLIARADLVSQQNDVVPAVVPARALIQLAARKLAGGGAFESERAMYLRAPDVKEPSAPKRVVA